MGLWDSASKSLPGGVALGVRVRENEEDRAERKTWREEQKRQFEAGNKRADAAAAREQEEYDYKKEYKKTRSSFDVYDAMYKAGIENEDTNMQRSAAAGLANLYNSKLPNGDEVKIIFKSDAANNPELSEKWNSDEKLKDKDVAVLSKSGGIMPFKNLNDVFKFAAAGLNMENFTAGIKQAEAKVAELNAREEPFMGNDGKYYARSWKMGKGGMPEKSDPVPYEGVTKASKLRQDVTDTETVLGKRLSSEEQRIKAGLSKPETASEAELNRAKASKARAEGSAALGGGKNGGDALKGADLDKMKKSLNLLLTPFVKKGEQVLDPETGDMTQAGTNAYAEAADLVDKAQNEPDKLTKKEKRDLPHAVRATEVYKRISASVTAGYISKEDADAMNKGKEPPVNYKDGNWHTIPNGEHKGKEARYNPEKKKYEIRERSGVSASFEPDEPGAQASPGPSTPSPAAAQPETPRREPTAMEQNATRAGLVAGAIGANREKSALENLTTEDLAEAGRAALAAVTSPARRVMDDYEEQKRRSGR